MTETQLVALMAAMVYAGHIGERARGYNIRYDEAVDKAVELHRAVQFACPQERCFRDGSIDQNCVPVLSTETGWGNQ